MTKAERKEVFALAQTYDGKCMDYDYDLWERVNATRKAHGPNVAATKVQLAASLLWNCRYLNGEWDMVEMDQIFSVWKEWVQVIG